MKSTVPFTFKGESRAAQEAEALDFLRAQLPGLNVHQQGAAFEISDPVEPSFMWEISYRTWWSVTPANCKRWECKGPRIGETWRGSFAKVISDILPKVYPPSDDERRAALRGRLNSTMVDGQYWRLGRPEWRPIYGALADAIEQGYTLPDSVDADEVVKAIDAARKWIEQDAANSAAQDWIEGLVSFEPTP